MTELTVVTIIRNGIQNGYPFVESLASWFSDCDRIFVLDGWSDDGTELILQRIAALDERFTFASEPWPKQTQGGTSIADFTNRMLAHVRGLPGNLMYVQADEVYTPEQRRIVRAESPDRALEFKACINFWNGFDRVLANDFPMTYLRRFPNREDIRSLADGFSFSLGDTPVLRLEQEILHYGWCFPVNILQKHVSHSRIYRDNADYRLRGRVAQAMLARGELRPSLLDALEPGYEAVPFTSEHPACMEHLLGGVAYDPYVGLRLLERGAADEW